MADLGSSRIFGKLTVIHDAEVKGVITGDGSGLTGTASLRATGTTKADVGLSNIPNLSVTDSATGNTIMQRNSSGDTWARLFRSSYSTPNSNIAGIYTTRAIGGDYMRPSTPAQVKAALSISSGDVSGLSDAATTTVATIRSGTTKADVGLGNVPNVDTTNASNISSGTLAYARLPISLSQVSNWDTAHNWGDHSLAGYFDSTTGKATKATAEAGTNDTQWMSPLKTLQSIQANAIYLQQYTNVLTAGVEAATNSINEFQSSISVNLPLANSVPANTVSSFIVQNKYKSGTKTINVQGTDTVSDEVGTNTSVVLSDGFSGRVYLISDGVSDWRF